MSPFAPRGLNPTLLMSRRLALWGGEPRLAISESGKAEAFSSKEKALQIKLVAGAGNQRRLHLDYGIL